MAFFTDHPGRIFVVAATLPLLTAVILFLFGTVKHLLKKGNNQRPAVATAGLAAILTMLLSAVCSIIGTVWLINEPGSIIQTNFTQIVSRWSESFEFLRIGGHVKDARPGLVIPLGYTIDRLTALMMCMVTIISTLIFTFSLGYMRDELKTVHDHDAYVERRGRFARFYFYLLLFAFSMLQLLIADNLLQIFVGWELVGTCSFFLIGFYYERKSASTAANKAFIMNRIGDAGFLIALAIAFTSWGTFNISQLSERILISSGLGSGITNDAIVSQMTVVNWSQYLWTVMGFGLFAGCVGKSAQFPLQTWLPDAMQGPTPVSALIHAATMVAAGVYLCARCLPLFAPEVLNVIAYTGAITLFISAAVACVQTDIKRVLAFSTCSQLGFMMLALGLSGWTAGLFHLLTHAFFKALLFLCAGSVIYALHHEQNLIKMGGLRRRAPITAYTMLVGVAAIIGVPLFSGWYSKDTILSVVLEHYRAHGQPLLLILPFFTVVLTAYYMVRLWLLAFAGESRADHDDHEVHESPAVMTIPLLVLAAFSIGIAWGWPLWDAHASYLAEILRHEDPYDELQRGMPQHDHTAGIAAAIAMALGVIIAVVIFRSGQLQKPSRGPLTRLLQQRFYFDAIYYWLFTKPTLALSRAVGGFDKQAPDGDGRDLTLDGVLTAGGRLLSRAGRGLAPLQAGRIREYVAALGLTVVAGLAILWVRTR